MAAKLKINYFYIATKFSSTNLLSAKSVGNSNDYGQLKSIDDNSDNYSRSTLIATAIRNAKSDNVRWKSQSTNDNGSRQLPTMKSNDQRSTCIDNV